MAQKSQPNPSRGRGPISEGRGRISEARRTQILEAAVRVIGERGLCDSRISDIAREAGASSALVVYYFGSKERLLGEALAFSEERFYGQTAEELESIPTATGQLIKLIELSCASQDGDLVELETQGLGRLRIHVRDDLKRTWDRETRLDRQQKRLEGTTPQLAGKHAPAAR